MTDRAILALLLCARQAQQKSLGRWLGPSAKCLIRQKVPFDAAMTPH
jgi:hypothetical protein